MAEQLTGVLVDSSVLVASERRPEALEAVLAREPHGALSVVTIAEYWKGIERAETAARRQRRIEVFGRLTGRFAVIDVDREIALAAARLWADLAKAGRALSDFDLLIAATAVGRGLRLATLDADFARVPGLELVDVEPPP